VSLHLCMDYSSGSRLLLWPTSCFINGGNLSKISSHTAGTSCTRGNVRYRSTITVQSFSILVASVLAHGEIATKVGRPASTVRSWPISSRDGPIRAETHGLLGPKQVLFAGHEYDRHRCGSAVSTVGPNPCSFWHRVHLRESGAHSRRVLRRVLEQFSCTTGPISLLPSVRG